MKVQVVLTNNEAQVPFKKHESDFGLDVVATSCEEIAPNVYKYGLGIKCQLDPTERERATLTKEALFGLSIRPRSSVWKTGMVFSNCIGTIDEEYTGEISAVFYHVFPSMPKYEIGDRIVQIHADIQPRIEWQVVESLRATIRGEGSYGSTGK